MPAQAGPVTPWNPSRRATVAICGCDVLPWDHCIHTLTKETTS